MQSVRRLLVISDIHGQIRQFNELLDKIEFDETKDLLFLIGDYVDRGENPKAVIAKVRELEKKGAIALKGNHESMMEKALSGKDPMAVSLWAANGGAQTLQSYGLDIQTVYRQVRDGQLTLPEDLLNDLDWIVHLNIYAQTEHYIFVHAGVDPERRLEDTDEETLLWIRDPFFNGYHGEKTVIFGHTPTMNFQPTCDVYFGKNNIIGIDGGCVFGGQLNCLELPSKTTYSVKANSSPD